jgi:hypothetical protein
MLLVRCAEAKPSPYPQPHQACDLSRIGDVAPLRKREKEGAHRASTAMFYEETAACQFRKEKERSMTSGYQPLAFSGHATKSRAIGSETFLRGPAGLLADCLGTHADTSWLRATLSGKTPTLHVWVKGMDAIPPVFWTWAIPSRVRRWLSNYSNGAACAIEA